MNRMNGALASRAMATAASTMREGLGAVRESHTLEMRVQGERVVEQEEKRTMTLDVCFLLDVSGSMSGAAAQEMDRQLNWFLFESRLLEGKDTVQIVVFNSEVSELLRPIYVERLDRAAIDALAIPARCSGGTRLWTALNFCLDSRRDFQAQREQRKREQARAQGRPAVPSKKKAFVLLALTDGASHDSHVPIVARLQQGIGREIAHFHMHLLGVGIDASNQAIMAAVAAAHKDTDFTNIPLGAGVHAEGAIADSFRTHFTRKVKKVLHVERVVRVGSDGRATFEEVQRDHRGRQVGHSLQDMSSMLSALPALEGPRAGSAAAAAVAASAGPNPSAPVHKRPCRNGASCPALQTKDGCSFKHDQGDLLCRYGAHCTKVASGDCKFRHDAHAAPASARAPPRAAAAAAAAGPNPLAPVHKRPTKEGFSFKHAQGDVLCRFGARCTKVASGDCKFRHDLDR